MKLSQSWRPAARCSRTSPAPRRVSATAVACVLLVAAGCGGGGGGGDSAGSGGGAAPTGDVAAVVRWNTIAIDATGRDHTATGGRQQLGPVRAARAMAIVHAAIGDVAAAQSGRFQPFIPIDDAPSADFSVAVAQAAHDTLVNVFSKQQAIFDAALTEDLALVADSPAKTAGITLGKTAAANSIAFCDNDGSERGEPFVQPTYVPSNDVGKWRKDPLNPNQPIVGSTWAVVRPFVLESSAQFRLPPPPDLASAEYAAAFNEVKALGGDGVNTPTVRTLDQSAAAIFWAYDGTPSLCAPPRFFNQIAVQIALDRGTDGPDLARYLGLINIAMMDAGSVSWESKYFYSHWRPITGIREADQGTGPTGKGDSNPDTQGDPNYVPLGAPASNQGGKDFTPPFPTYPSGHATFGGAIFEVMRNFFGTDDIPFTMVSDEFNGATTDSFGTVRPLLPRSFRTLSEAEEENGQSRIYLGIHWSYDKTSGITLGRQVGDYVYERIYQPR